MPVVITTITAVYGPRPVKLRSGRWAEKFDVQTAYRLDGYHSGAFETWSPFAASVCRLALKAGIAVRLIYKDAPKWGSEIVDVDLVKKDVAS